jgi:hypothetical protein
MKVDYLDAKIQSHRANLQRYARLLATPLTELEREYLRKRIAEERAEVAHLEMLRESKSVKSNRETAAIVPNLLPPRGAPHAPSGS